ncbi:MAG: FAD/NAD(P)-binding protein [Brachybacterium sp.]
MAERAPGTTPAPVRLLVVGAGAKALFALEELASRWREGTGPRIEITVVNPGEHLGTGAAYHPFQPHHLRLNVGSGILDAPATGAVPSFPDWALTTHPELAEEPYPPRAVVGEYLRLRWRRMQEALAPWARLRHHRGRALAVHRDGERWQVDVTGSPQVLGPVEEVLLVTGHAASHDSSLAPAWTAALPLRPSVLPVQEMLSAEHVPPGCRVAMRGGALTFVDGALTLTLGRGAVFCPDPSGARGLVHHRSPEEPAVILPTTRHGLLLDAKPSPRAPLPAAAERARAHGARRLESAGPLSPQQVLDLVVDVAAEMLASTSAPSEERRRAVAHTLATGAEPDRPPGPGRAERALRHSVAVAEGSRPGGPAWALGRTWVLLYPQLTAALRGSDADHEGWSRFLTSAQVLERFAFGPPLDVARMLIAMIDSGALDLSWVDAGTALRADGVHRIPAGAAGPDVVIDAVVAPPGLLGVREPLAEHLLGSGLVTVRPGRRGAVVAPDGTALTAAGQRAEGLCLLGRATEDHVIGHDTLNRHLHAETAHWAARLARRAALPAALEETV